MTNDLGKNLKRLRKAAKISAKTLSLAIGASPSYVSELERGRAKSPGVDYIVALAEKLGVSVAELRGTPGVAEAYEPTMFSFDKASLADMDMQFADTSAAAEALLKEQMMPSDPRSVSLLALRLWRRTLAHGAALPFTERLELALSEVRSELRPRWESFLRNET